MKALGNPPWLGCQIHRTHYSWRRCQIWVAFQRFFRDVSHSSAAGAGDSAGQARQGAQLPATGLDPKEPNDPPPGWSVQPRSRRSRTVWIRTSGPCKTRRYTRLPKQSTRGVRPVEHAARRLELEFGRNILSTQTLNPKPYRHQGPPSPI